MKGKIKNVIESRGYGFIETDENENDLFFHRSQLQDLTFEDLQAGLEVEFETEDTPKGLQAINIKAA
ncbi:MAG: cold shock domain-containing protein [Candidatus Kariarchaeaceae archaeon]|jgi:CspA family cold shock protein